MRLLTPLVVVCVCLLAVAGLASWSRMTEVVRQALDIARHGGELDREAAFAVQRNEDKAAVVRDVVDGRLTFRPALARFRALYREECAAGARGMPDDEWLARNLALWVYHVLTDRAKLTDARIAHLDPELRRLLRDPHLLDQGPRKRTAAPALKCPDPLP